MMRSIRRSSLLVSLFGALAPGLASAFIDVAPPASTVSIDWVGGDIESTVDFCVTSVQGNQSTGTTVLPYDITVTSSTAGLNIAGPGAAIPVEVEWRDLAGGGIFPLAHGVATSRTNQGAVAGCPAGNNGRARLVLLASELQARQPGTYSATFSFRARNAAAGRKIDTATLTLNVTIPTVLHVSGLDSIDLGAWNGLSDMQGTDTLCVYINSGVLYTVTAVGAGTGGVFQVSNGSRDIGFDMSWSDSGLGTGALPLAPATPLTNRGNAATASLTCGGGASNNATLSVTVPVANLQSVAGSGVFSGTVTLTVQAQ